LQESLPNHSPPLGLAFVGAVTIELLYGAPMHHLFVWIVFFIALAVLIASVRNIKRKG
jgi:hypothetical protein